MSLVGEDVPEDVKKKTGKQKEKMTGDILGKAGKRFDKGVEQAYKMGKSEGYEQGRKDTEEILEKKVREIKNNAEAVNEIAFSEKHEMALEYDKALSEKDRKIEELERLGEDLYKGMAAVTNVLQEYLGLAQEAEEVEVEIPTTAAKKEFEKTAKDIRKTLQKLQ